jgi:hypothetical protein
VAVLSLSTAWLIGRRSLLAVAIRELIGVYDADGTIWGAVSYWIGARLGRQHCSLCDITHGLVSMKSEWRECRDSLPVPFVTYHRNDQPDDVRTCIGERLPAVVARTDRGVEFLVGPQQLAECHADPRALSELLRSLLVGR